MADNIKLVTYSGSTVTPLDDALVYEKAIGQSGIIYGAEITLKNTNTLHISAGHGVICGRKFSVVDSDIPVQLTAGATNPGRVYIHLDLSNTTEPIQIMTEVAATLTTPIQQEDVNINNGVYEFDMATFTIDAQTISEVVNVFPTIENTTGNLGELTTEDKSSLVAAVNEVNKKGVAVLDSYEEIMANTSNGKAAGAKGVKEGFAQLSDSLQNIGKWTKLTSVVGATGINLPTSFNEILIALSQAESDYTIESTILIPYIDLIDVLKYYDTGSSQGTNRFGYRVGVSKSLVVLNSAFINTGSVTASVTVKVYYR